MLPPIQSIDTLQEVHLEEVSERDIAVQTVLKRSFKCHSEGCHHSYPDQIRLNRHIYQARHFRDSDMMKCIVLGDLCSFMSTSAGISRHVAKVHPDAVYIPKQNYDAMATIDVNCCDLYENCFTTFKPGDGLIYHFRQVHGISIKKTQDTRRIKQAVLKILLASAPPLTLSTSFRENSVAKTITHLPTIMKSDSLEFSCSKCLTKLESIHALSIHVFVNHYTPPILSSPAEEPLAVDDDVAIWNSEDIFSKPYWAEIFQEEDLTSSLAAYPPLPH